MPDPTPDALNALLHPYRLEQPWALVLLPLLLVLLIVAWRRRLPSLVLANVVPVQMANSGRVAGRVLRLPLLLETLAIALLIIALARPQYGRESRTQQTQGIDIMLAFDISQSMSLLDIPMADGLQEHERRSRAITAIRDGSAQPRVDLAKAELLRFIDRRPADRLGLVAFATYAYVACPPTLDHDFLRGRVEQLDAGMFRFATNTNIAAPLASAVNRLKESPAKRRVIVLFTDGQHNTDSRITPRDAAKLAAQYDIIVHTVGIGSNQAWSIRESNFGRRFLEPVPDLSYDAELLQQIADDTGGQFFSAADAAGFAQVMTDIDQLEKIEIEQRVYVHHSELYQPWLWSGIALLLLAILLEHTLFLRVP